MADLLVAGCRILRPAFTDNERVHVTRGRDAASRSDVVVKTIAEAGESAAVERFRREAVILDLLTHRAIVRLKRYSDAPPRAMVLEYVPGSPLGRIVADRGPLAPGELCAVAGEIAAALDVAHAHGVVHRDLCPEHVIVLPRGGARLIDFGAASLDGEPEITLMGELLRDHAFVAPEQLRAASAADARSDIYSLAAVCFYALTGKSPSAAGDDPAASLEKIRPTLPPAVTAVVARGMSADPSERYASAGQMAADLRIAVVGVRKARFGMSPRSGFWKAAVVPLLLLLAAASVLFMPPHGHGRPVKVSANAGRFETGSHELRRAPAIRPPLESDAAPVR